MINLGHGFYVQLGGCDDWGVYIITLIRFKQIRSPFHLEAGTYFCGDKFHQLCYFIRMFNDKLKNIFVLEDHCAFDEGGITMMIRYCPVRMYNKNKPEKYRVNFSSLTMRSII